MSPVLLFGINHHSAPIAVRECLAFSKDTAAAALKTLIDHPHIHEAVILSTCNRTEIYAVASDSEYVKQWLMQHHQLNHLDISPFCYDHQGLAAVQHLMRVASGLDSMIIGEPQILGQIKEAFQHACDAGSVGVQLQQLFPAVFSTSKHIRTATQIGRCPVSLAYAIVKLCHGFFSTLTQCNLLFIGAGTTIELIATHLAAANVHSMLIANRGLDRATQLAASFNATAITLDDIPSYLDTIDIIISATDSPDVLLKKNHIEHMMQHRQHRPLLIVDLAVPRDIDPDIAIVRNTRLYNIDDLREIINDNASNRHSAAVQAESMIELYVADYMRQLRINDASEIITNYRSSIESHCDTELNKALTALASGKDPEAVLKNFAYNFSNKIMHQPTVTLREAASDGHFNLLHLAKELFK